MNFIERITIDPEICSGKPCIKGTYVTVYDILEELAEGMTVGEILDDHPDIETEDVYGVLKMKKSLWA